MLTEKGGPGNQTQAPPIGERCSMLEINMIDFLTESYYLSLSS